MINAEPNKTAVIHLPGMSPRVSVQNRILRRSKQVSMPLTLCNARFDSRRVASYAADGQDVG